MSLAQMMHMMTTMVLMNPCVASGWRGSQWVPEAPRGTVAEPVPVPQAPRGTDSASCPSKRHSG